MSQGNSTVALAITSAPASQSGPGSILKGDNPLHESLALFLVQVALIIIVCRVLSIAFKKIRQPAVIAEVIGGILLGPS